MTRVRGGRRGGGGEEFGWGRVECASGVLGVSFLGSWVVLK